MSLAAMSAVMLIIALLFGLMPETEEKLGAGKFPILAALILAPVLRMAVIEPSLRFGFNLGSVFALALTGFIAFRKSPKRILPAAAVSAAAAVPAFLLMNALKGDAAVLAAALTAVPAALIVGSVPEALFASALLPVFAAVYRFVFGALSGFGAAELTRTDLDVQLTGVLFALFALELRRFNRRAAESAAEDRPQRG